MKASKKQAVQLINEAVRTGWRRTIHVGRLSPTEAPYIVQVLLEKKASLPGSLFYEAGSIIVAFPRRPSNWSTPRRCVPSVTVIHFYGQEDRTSRGVSSARHLVEEINYAASHQRSVQAAAAARLRDQADATLETQSPQLATL